MITGVRALDLQQLQEAGLEIPEPDDAKAFVTERIQAAVARAA